MPGKNRALKGKMRCVGVRQLQQAISDAAGEVKELTEGLRSSHKRFSRRRRAPGVSRRYVAVSGERALRRDVVRRKSIPWRERQAKEHSVGIVSGERALRRGERITIGASEKLSIRLGALGTLVCARVECFTPEGARSILLLLWRGMFVYRTPWAPLLECNRTEMAWQNRNQVTGSRFFSLELGIILSLLLLLADRMEDGKLEN
ncbi:hypothetical protein DFP73DRAFT_596311 [Morchella snyderi]|nr:hypothetical protein DFP73DRAFT_596311 [Morchella snyderi]